jgi:2-polyprenyl-3-methyl-5-hydroxy-6-metoxy-1,4-benzoquinol methylase
MNCEVCNSTEIKELFRKDDLTFFACSHCNLIFTSPGFSLSDVKKIYNEDYYNPWKINDVKVSARHNKVPTFNRWLFEIEKYITRGRILDIGCANGFFLEVAQEHGWVPYGVEISDYSSKIAQRKFGSHVFRGSLNDAHFDSESFDVVTAFDLIEHLLSPIQFLYEVFRVLKPGGIMAIVTADTKSFSCKLMGKNWPHFKTEHLYYFSPLNAAAILKKAGFRVLMIKRANKILTINYIKSIMEVYHTPVLSRILTLLYYVLPRGLTNLPFCIPSGEMLIIAERA